ncbi:MAG TPA: heme-binding protein [Candidatus Binatia bacterium]|nr:heme-binding protein [Candidatus Binatia bacterium]
MKTLATRGAAVALACAFVAAKAGAEPPTTGRTVLTIDGAKKAAAAAVAEAKLHGDGGAIAVVDEGGNLLYLERLDGTFPAGANVSIGKARTAALFQKPTAAFEDVIKAGRTPMIALADFTPLQGGVPIVVDGKVVGAIGVSGAATQQRDEAVAKAGAAALP